jgi:hypothetical protein
VGYDVENIPKHLPRGVRYAVLSCNVLRMRRAFSSAKELITLERVNLGDDKSSIDSGTVFPPITGDTLCTYYKLLATPDALKQSWHSVRRETSKETEREKKKEKCCEEAAFQLQATVYTRQPST